MSSIHALIGLSLAGLAMSCNSGPSAAADASDPFAPQLLSLSVDTDVLYPSESVTVTAILQVPEGGAPIATGLLLRDQVTLGTFAVTTPNTFTAQTTWEQMVHPGVSSTNKLEPAAASFRVQFFDEAGRQLNASQELYLSCPDDNNEALCLGSCVPTQTNKDACGGCKHCNYTIPDSAGFDKDASCSLGDCGRLLVGDTSEANRSCDEVCGEFSVEGTPMVCRDTCDTRFFGTSFFSDFSGGTAGGIESHRREDNSEYMTEISCTDMPSSSASLTVQECCCHVVR